MLRVVSDLLKVAQSENSAVKQAGTSNPKALSALPLLPDRDPPDGLPGTSFNKRHSCGGCLGLHPMALPTQKY